MSTDWSAKRACMDCGCLTSADVSCISTSLYLPCLGKPSTDTWVHLTNRFFVSRAPSKCHPPPQATNLLLPQFLRPLLPPPHPQHRLVLLVMPHLHLPLPRMPLVAMIPSRMMTMTICLTAMSSKEP
ncbi:hypothetical protein BDN72DRAFT_421221 [Pluteus cervinus]|uniref:Uncharacterized protein n=1 Tax=Pluteus cervinus TaxID=181527 RepID=A0ACD3A821_9AGAR|nr:hypothetical protein BDN72DRAFT_421221 [Pluteus cervinus]